MNRRSRFFRSGLMSGVGAAVAGIVFFAAPAQAGYAGTSCSECYVVIVTPATNPASVGAGTGDVYAFQVTNNDQHEALRSLTFTAPTDFTLTAATGPSGTSVSALPGSSVTLNLPSEGLGRTFTVDVTAQTPCVAASSEVWGVSGVDSLGETNEVDWSSSPLTVSVTGKCGLAFTGQQAQTAVNSNILTGFNSTGSPLAVQLVDAKNDPLNPANLSANGIPVTVSIQANPGGGTLSGTTTVDSSKGVAHFGNLQINKVGAGYDLAASASGFNPATLGFLHGHRSDPGLRQHLLGVAVDCEHGYVNHNVVRGGQLRGAGTRRCHPYVQPTTRRCRTWATSVSSTLREAPSRARRPPPPSPSRNRPSVVTASAPAMAGLLRVADVPSRRSRAPAGRPSSAASPTTRDCCCPAFCFLLVRRSPCLHLPKRKTATEGVQLTFIALGVPTGTGNLSSVAARSPVTVGSAVAPSAPNGRTS